MNFLPTAEQDMLRNSLAATFRRSGAAADLAELGVFGLLVPEAHGGSGLGMSEAAIVLHEAGRAGVGVGMAGGDLAATLLFAEALGRARPDLAASALVGGVPVLAPVAGELTLRDGRVSGVLNIAEPVAGTLVAATLAGTDELAFLPAAGLPCTPRPALEAARQSCHVVVDIPARGLATAALPGLRDRLALLACAEMLGAADFCFALAVAYMKDRQQFGQPIGANQGLRHIAADSYLQLENARVAVDFAAAARDAADNAASPAGEAQAARAMAVLRAYVPGAARDIVETAIHLHGGIGLTWDYGLNAPLRRILRLGMAAGSPSGHRQALCNLVLAANSGGGA